MKDLEFTFHMDVNGFHWLSCNDVVGEKVSYQGISSLTIDGRIFVGMTAFYKGVFPHEQAIEMVSQPTNTKNCSNCLEGNICN